jgi:hypothetical protein
VRSSQEVTLRGKRLTLSNLDKVLYPKAGFTKAQVIDFYLRIAPLLLRHLRDRPLTLKRYPDGVEGGYFYEKNCPAHRPPWVRTASIRSARNERATQYCLVQDAATLAWAANLADLELHVPLHRGCRRAPARGGEGRSLRSLAHLEAEAAAPRVIPGWEEKGRLLPKPPRNPAAPPGKAVRPSRRGEAPRRSG